MLIFGKQIFRKTEVFLGKNKKKSQLINKDDMIYKFIQNMADENSTSNILKTIPMDRDETIKTFENFKNKMDKTIY